MDIYTVKLIAVFFSAVASGICMHVTKSSTGIGWFAFSLLIIF